MNNIYKYYLFSKHILVGDEDEDESNRFETLFSLANLFNIRIIEGEELINKGMIEFASERLGIKVPAPFYQNFPESVRSLSPDQLLFDQLVHYSITYGLGNFSEAGHSLFEGKLEKMAFKENTPIKDFKIVTEDKAEKLLAEIVDGLLGGSRPLSHDQYELVKEYIVEFDYRPKSVASKNTAIKLMNDTKELYFSKFLVLSDVVKVVDLLNYYYYANVNVKKLNLRNQDRKYITSLIDIMTTRGKCDIINCYEKRKLWNGLLHHIHYKPKNEEGKHLLDAMRGGKNESVYSRFEQKMSEGLLNEAADVLINEKGSAAFLRNLDYIISRAKTPEEVSALIDRIDSKNRIVLLQLYIKYCNEVIKQENRAEGDPPGKRSFSFIKYEMMKVYTETEEDVVRRKSVIPAETVKLLKEKLCEKLKEQLAGRLGKVYVAPGMENFALPLKEGASQGGFGVLPKGSRIHIGETKKLRAFTYWEKVNDIDLSAIGLDADGMQYEFSWRTMAHNQSEAITYSGDETSGYYGGSEYFDINIDVFRETYPKVRYIVLCDNVFSCLPFSKCICRAGYMLRDINDSGEIYEPKTVNSAYTINCESTFAYLFGLDLEKNDFIWLNMSRNGTVTVAGETSFEFLFDYFRMTDIMNMDSFFRLMATEVVDSPEKADVVVANSEITVPEGTEVIREFDFEKLLKLL